MKKKLLFVISQLYSGGAERSLVNLLRSLSADKYDVDLLVLYQSPDTKSVKNTSLLPEVPDWVRVCNATPAEKNDFFSKVHRHLLYSGDQRETYPAAALDFVRGKTYDWAFHVGEWLCPDFVAQEVCAVQKAMWIHTDINAAKSFDAEKYFLFLEQFDKVLFVSRQSMLNSCKKYPFLQEKADVIYNICDVQQIRRRAEEEFAVPSAAQKPIVVTVANLRPEKNHLRQVEAMKKLKDAGVDFQWWNVGSKADGGTVSQVQRLIAQYSLEDDFLLLGAKDNPYPYIKRADIVTCLSDYESWSMVITEAKLLGKFIAATNTSGAMEQIADHETGLLCDFSADAIAAALKEALTDAALRQKVEAALTDFDNTREILESFDRLVVREKAADAGKDILYVVDDVNYPGGAHFATINQIAMLNEAGTSVDVFSLTLPSVKTRTALPNVHFLSWNDVLENRLYQQKLFSCLFDRHIPFGKKLFKLKMSLRSKQQPRFDVFGAYVWPGITEILSAYGTVCVMSEGSQMKPLVAKCRAEKKIQWIHTDYCSWAETPYGKTCSKDDGELWEEFTSIVVLSSQIRDKLARKYPQLAEKISVIPNIMPTEKILNNSQRKKKPFPPVNFVTVCRFEKVKAIPRLLDVLQKLCEEGYDFHWTFVGCGEEFEECFRRATASPMHDRISFVGNTDNPYPYVKEADVFALFSYNEGLPNTIYEALILGVPVCATDVGGIAGQIEPGVTGWLVKNDEDSIFDALVHILEHQEEIAAAKEALKTYTYDNSAIKEAVLTVFGK